MVLVAGAMVFAPMEAARQHGLLEPLELLAYDAFIRNRPDSIRGQPPVTVVEIAEPDIRALGTWPVPDDALARVLELLAGFGPRAIGVDIFRDTPVPPGRANLDQVLATRSNVVVVYRFSTLGEIGVHPPPGLAGTDQIGFNDVLVDPGGIVRRGLLFLSGDRPGADGSTERVTGYSFALRLALRYLQGEGVQPVPDPENPSHVRIGPSTLPPLESHDGSYVGLDARGYQFFFDYRRKAEDFPRLALTDVLAGKVDPALFEDKVVLIGTTAISVPDHFYTPHSLGRDSAQQTPGVVLHGQSVDQLVRLGLGREAPMRFLSGRAEVGWVLLWSLAGALAGMWIGSARAAVLVAVLGLGLLLGITFAAFVHDWWIPLVPPAAAWLLAAGIVTAYRVHVETAQRRLLMNLFSRHVDPQLADSIWAQREKFLEGGRPSSAELTATVMFTDIHGFTTVSERLSPGDLMEWLNDYMEAMTPLVMEHDGVILRFIGDAIMAVFGAPLARTSEEGICEDARNAVRCALAMQHRLIRHNRDLQRRGLPMIGMRMGIYTGTMVGGSLGNRHRLEYNLHGDNVNIAARLESYDKGSFEPDPLAEPCRILIGEPTQVRLRGAFRTVPLGEAALKGKGRKVMIHRVFETTPEPVQEAGDGEIVVQATSEPDYRRQARTTH